MPLNGTLQQVDDWLQEAGYQHAGSTSLNLLGVQAVPHTIPGSAGTPSAITR
jgi:hypothetical protein